MKRFGFVAVCAGLLCHAEAQSSPRKQISTRQCRHVVFEGEVKAGQGYEKVFAQGLRFYLEPLSSGWIVRVLSTDTTRGAHDYAELATPPYKSVNPLLISTDWAFRAQDAIAWNPRRFRYVSSGAAFRELEGLYDGVMRNDPRAVGEAALVVAAQPEAVLQILGSRILPGMADQSRMASMVAENLAQTPHDVDQSLAPTALGRLEEIHFRVSITLPVGLQAGPQVHEEKKACLFPTT